jgi:hypothetical protein
MNVHAAIISLDSSVTAYNHDCIYDINPGNVL